MSTRPQQRTRRSVNGLRYENHTKNQISTIVPDSRYQDSLDSYHHHHRHHHHHHHMAFRNNDDDEWQLAK